MERQSAVAMKMYGRTSISRFSKQTKQKIGLAVSFQMVIFIFYSSQRNLISDEFQTFYSIFPFIVQITLCYSNPFETFLYRLFHISRTRFSFTSSIIEKFKFIVRSREIRIPCCSIVYFEASAYAAKAAFQNVQQNSEKRKARYGGKYNYRLVAEAAEIARGTVLLVF